MEGGRTPLHLRRMLMKELEVILQDMRFQSPNDMDRIKMRIYGQYLPKIEHTQKDMDEFRTIDYIETSNDLEGELNAPWCMVKIAGWETDEINGNVIVSLAICFGIYDTGLISNGDEEILNLVQRVYMRFAKDPILAKQYTYTGDFKFEAQDEETYPYYFGSIATSFSFVGLRRESIYT